MKISYSRRHRSLECFATSKHSNWLQHSLPSANLECDSFWYREVLLEHNFLKACFQLENPEKNEARLTFADKAEYFLSLVLHDTTCLCSSFNIHRCLFCHDFFLNIQTFFVFHLADILESPVLELFENELAKISNIGDLRNEFRSTVSDTARERCPSAGAWLQIYPWSITLRKQHCNKTHVK